MYHIEVLPTSNSRSAPGYTYIADAHYIDPSKAPILPSSNSRKRARISTAAHPNNPYNTSSPSSHNKNDTDGDGRVNGVSARQASKIAKHIADLDRENHKDVAAIVVPGKSKDVALRGISHEKGRVMTSGVRKILGSQKAWANWLGDEEAALALKGGLSGGGAAMSGGGGTTVVGGVVAGGAVTVERKDVPMTAAERKRIRDRESKALKRRKSGLRGVENVDAQEEEKAKAKEQDVNVDAEGRGETTDVNVNPEDASSQPQPAQQAQQSPYPAIDPGAFINTDESDDPSLLPPLPTQAQIMALLAQPPLSYNASRAAPSTSTAPPRKFCEICGYWGRVVCVKCGARVCGIECKEAHDESRCLKFYA